MVAASMAPATVTILPIGTQLPSAPAKTTGATSTLNQNDFLTLLTTQLEHQDPLNPQSPSDFAAELAQFTTASGVQTLNTTLGTGSGLQAASLVGKNVAVPGNALVLGSGGNANGAFNLSATAKDVNVAVLNASGSIVNTIDLGPMAAGSQNFVWNGKAADGRRCRPAPIPTRSSPRLLRAPRRRSRPWPSCRLPRWSWAARTGPRSISAAVSHRSP